MLFPNICISWCVANVDIIIVLGCHAATAYGACGCAQIDTILEETRETNRFVDQRLELDIDRPSSRN